MSEFPPLDPERDLVLERDLDVPPEKVWRAWTDPESLKQWFCPKPWRTPVAEMDVRPGGIFHTVLEGPNPGEREDVAGCYLEVAKNERLVWTSAMGPGYRPLEKSFLPFTAILTLTKKGIGTHYHVRLLHPDRETKERHEKMGFHEGWGMALDQMVEHIHNYS